VLIGVSGGADSIALAAGLAELSLPDREPAPGPDGCRTLVIAHFDHRLRADSRADAAFVAEFAARKGLRVELGSAADDLRETARGSVEEAARAARYQWFADQARAIGADRVAVAHTRDDQVETILFNVLRGVSATGPMGMLPQRSLAPGIELVRPLLDVPRAALTDWLNSRGIPWRDDPTNADPEFTRNRIRHRILPLLRTEVHPGVDGALLRLAESARETGELVERSAAALLEAALVLPSSPIERDRADPGDDAFASNGVEDERTRTLAFDRSAWGNEPATIVAHAIRLAWRRALWPGRGMTRDHWRRLADLALRPEPAREQFPGGVSGVTNGNRLTLEVRPSVDGTDAPPRGG
jgi:tRNA(Ile)-lysidine synthase